MLLGLLPLIWFRNTKERVPTGAVGCPILNFLWSTVGWMALVPLPWTALGDGCVVERNSDTDTLPVSRNRFRNVGDNGYMNEYIPCLLCVPVALGHGWRSVC